MKNSFALRFAVCVIALSICSAATAAEVDVLFLRGKVGPSYYSNLEPFESVFGYELDLGFRYGNGFGWTAMAKLNPEDSKYVVTYTFQHLSSRYLAMGPDYSVQKGLAVLTFGIGAGLFSTSTDLDGRNADSSTRFALSPNLNLELEVMPSFTIDLGVMYVAAFGASPQPGFLSATGGVGVRF